MKDPDQPRRLLKQMVMIRRFEEKCVAHLDVLENPKE